jgi:hypothetical protein
LGHVFCHPRRQSREVSGVYRHGGDSPCLRGERGCFGLVPVWIMQNMAPARVW